MPGTNRLYLADSYLAACSSQVVMEQDGWWLLQDTVFYPGGGGQPGDTGRIDTVDESLTVVKVRHNADLIWHQVNRTAAPGTEVTCTIDWDRRYSFMRHHALLHIVNSLALRRYGALITGTLIGTDLSRVDFRFEEFDRSILSALETEVNEVIGGGHRVSTETISEAEFQERPDLIRTANVLPPITNGEVRVVNLEGFDAQACGGTHVHSTYEIGRARIQKYENKGRNNKRIYWALAD